MIVASSMVMRICGAGGEADRVGHRSGDAVDLGGIEVDEFEGLRRDRDVGHRLRRRCG